MRTHSMKYVIVVFSLDTQEIKADVCKCVDDSGIWTATERVKTTTGKICDVCKVTIFLRRVHISPNSQFIKILKRHTFSDENFILSYILSICRFFHDS